MSDLSTLTIDELRQRREDTFSEEMLRAIDAELECRQVKFNVYAFGRDVKRIQKKLERARTDKSKAKWARDLRDFSEVLENNIKRLAQMTESKGEI